MITDTAQSSKNKRRIIIGAAFLSAINAFGPSLMTQIAVFSEQYGSSFVWIILITGIVNIIILSASWLLITGQGKTVTELADELMGGCGVIISVLFAFCCICFNIGNICGIVSGLGLLLPADTRICALIAGALCLPVVMTRKSKLVDAAVTVFAFLIIAVLICTLAESRNGSHAYAPSAADGLGSLLAPVVCMLFGSYIPFIGGHSLLSQGVKGRAASRTVLLAAIASASVTLIMRLLISLTDLAVIAHLGTLGESNPSAAVFPALLGGAGGAVFAVIQIIISISCIYASTFCFNTFASHFTKREIGRGADILLVILCTAVIFLWGRPEGLMVIAGIISGMLTPISLLVLILTGIKRAADGRRRLPLAFTAILAIIFIMTTASVIASLTN